MSQVIDLASLSRFAARALAARPALAAELATPVPFSRGEMAQALDGAKADDETAFKRRLRRLRERVLLRVMARDLVARAPLAEVCAAMSDLAELAFACALDWLGASDLVIVGMGKLGGRELNVSSDVDLVFLHPDAAGAQRLEVPARRLSRLLAELTEDGFVFRVDLRLRPYGDSGPLVCSYDFLESYFVAQGREWERYAWIKARALTGSQHEALAQIVRPFVYRKYLDYATLDAMRRLHAEVRRDVERRELAEHVKLGPGGIREIEFVAQALQLVRGGRDPALTVRPTLAVLPLLAERNQLPQAAARELEQAYVFLRRVEHGLQYLDDAQRHDLPEDAADRSRIARMMRFADWAAFSAELARHRAAVARHFGNIFAERGAAGDAAWPDHPQLAALRASQRYAALPEDSRRRLDRVVPALARAAARTADPDATLARGIALLEAIASRAAYLALLAEHPDALERVARIISSSSWAAEFITRHPLLLDELLDDRLLYAPPDLAGFAANPRAPRGRGWRHRAAHEPAARSAPGAGVSAAGAGPRGPAGVLARRLRAIPGNERLGLGAPGPDARALLRRRPRDRRSVRGHPHADPHARARSGAVGEGDRRHARQAARRASQPERALRPQARPRRHDRYRVRGAVSGAGECAPAPRPHGQPRQHRAAQDRGRARPDRRGARRALPRGLSRI